MMIVLGGASSRAGEAKKIEQDLSKFGKSLEAASKKAVDDVNAAAKKADKEIRKSSLYEDAVKAGQNVWASLESGLKKVFSGPDKKSEGKGAK